MTAEDVVTGVVKKIDDTGNPDRLDRAVTWLLSSFATVTVVLAGLGAVNGGLERMLRNHPATSLVAFFLTSMAIGLAVLALSTFSGSSDMGSGAAADEHSALGPVNAPKSPNHVPKPHLVLASILFIMGGVVVFVGLTSSPVEPIVALGVFWAMSILPLLLVMALIRVAHWRLRGTIPAIIVASAMLVFLLGLVRGILRHKSAFGYLTTAPTKQGSPPLSVPFDDPVRWGLISGAILIALYVGATLGERSPFVRRRIIVTLSALSFVAGLLVATSVATVTPSGKERPRISAHLDNTSGVKLVGRVDAEGLRSSEHIVVSVDALKSSPYSSSPGAPPRGDDISWQPVRLLYFTQSGPDADGKVSVDISVPVPPDQSYDLVGVSGFVTGNSKKAITCEQLKSLYGCLILRLPRPGGAQLQTTWKAVRPIPILHVSVQAKELPYGAQYRLLIEDVSAGQRRRQLVSSALIPDDAGGFSSSRDVPLSGKIELLCVTAFPTYDFGPPVSLNSSSTGNACPNTTSVLDGVTTSAELLAVPK